MIAADPAGSIDVLDALTDGFMVLDGDWRITYVNSAAERLSGFRRDQLLGRNHWEVFPAAVGTAVHREFLWAASQRQTVEFENYYEPGGRWFRVKAYPSGRPGLVVFYEDITARKSEEATNDESLRSEREAREEAEILNQVSRTLSAELDLPLLLQAVTDAGVKLTGGNCGAFFYKPVNESSAGYLLYSSSGAAESIATLNAQQNDLLLQPLLAPAKFVRSEDVLHDSRFSGFALCPESNSEHRAIRSYLGVPVFSRSGDVLGGLVFAHPDPGVFSQRAERMVSGIAAHAAIAIDNARLFAKAEHEIARRKLAEDLTKRSEAKAREMIEALPAAIYTTDAEGFVTHFNSAAVKLSGRVPQVGQDRWCITSRLYGSDGEFLASDQSPMAVAMQGGIVSHSVEVMAERPDGSRFWCIPHPTPLRDTSGKIVGGINMLVDITDRKEAERASLLLKAIVESSDDAIISKNLDSIITSWNKGAERLFGYTAEEIIGKSVTILIPPDRQSEEPNILERLRRGERVDHFETIRVRKDGTQLNISLTISPVKDGRGRIIGASKIARNITDRRRAEAALRESEQRFRLLADSMPQMVWTARPDGYIDYYNERWYAFTGLPRNQFGDAGWEPILHPEDLSRCREAWYSSVQSGNAYAIEYRFWNRHQKRWCWFMGRALPARDEKTGAIVKWFGSCTDIDAQKSVEDELRRANQDLEQFAYSASHDLQEPLRAVKIYSELLTMRYRDKLEGAGVQFCDHLRTGATRMEMLVHDLLAYTQISKVEPPPERIDANRALQQALENLAGSISESGACVTSDALPALPVQPIHLVQVFQNLIGNAIKYRSPDRAPVVHVGVKQEGESFLFCVQDNGIGIDPAYKEQVFGLFKRLHTNEQYSGTGIGLAICQRILERYHGRIWLESQLGRGCTFYFKLPC